MIHPHSNDIVLFLEIRCHLIQEGDISVGTFSQQVSVDIHFTPVIYPFKVDARNLLAPVNFHVEMFPIPSDASREITRATGIVLRELPLH